MVQIEKWRVQKCKRPSPRWVAWKMRSKKRTGEIFDSQLEAVTYALLRQEVDAKMRIVSTTAEAIRLFT